MKTSPISYCFPTLLEFLEPRIAPATLVAGLTGQDYNSSEFISAADASADLAIATFFESSENIYYLALNTGDALKFDNDGNASTTGIDWLQVKGGKALAFFLDDGDKEIEQNELVGISLGGTAKMVVTGDVNGSIITNLDGTTKAFLGNSLADGAKNYITDLSVTGNVAGSIYTAGNISKATIGGSVKSIAVGTSAVGNTFSLGGGDDIGDGVVDGYTVVAGKVGSSISNVVVGGDVDLIWAGDGGNGAAGGSVTMVKVLANTGALGVYSGLGGDGDATHLNGGAGGKLSSVDVKSAANDVSSGTLITIESGHGGDGYFVSALKAGNGGQGGSIDKVSIGSFYDAKSKSWQPYDDSYLTYQDVSFCAGVGGSGKVAGNGGAITGAYVVAENSYISIDGGQGGYALDVKGAKVGNGGSVSNVFAISRHDGGDSSDGDEMSGVAIMAGSGGSYDGDAVYVGAGGAGGSIINVLGVAGSVVTLDAGVGTDGLSGGSGGSVSKVVANSTLAAVGSLIVNAGSGGLAETATGGNGGSIDNIVAGMAYNASTKSWEPMSDECLPLTVGLYAGQGATGKSGGIGGSISNAKIGALDTQINIMAGNGGDVSLDMSGSRGGNGGSVSNIAAISLTTSGESSSEIVINAGMGGSAEEIGNGGNGGAVTNVWQAGALNISIFAGEGGWGASGGSGGSVSKVDATQKFTPLSSFTLSAGSGGSAMTKVGGIGGALSSIKVDNTSYLEHITGQDMAPAKAQYLTLTGGNGDVSASAPSTGIWVYGGYSDTEGWVDSINGDVNIDSVTYGDIEVTGRIEGSLNIIEKVTGRLIINENALIEGELNISGNIDYGIYVKGEVYDEETGLVSEVLTPYSQDAFPELVLGTVTITDQTTKTVEFWQERGFDLEVHAGNGGEGLTGAGAGGSITIASFIAGSLGYSGAADGAADLVWNVAAGMGGGAGTETSKGGNGGSITGATFDIDILGNVETFTVAAGEGGSGGSVGGTGGNLDKLVVYVANDVTGEDGMLLQAGMGGGSMGLKSRGGAGGSISGCDVEAWHGLFMVSVWAGSGGDGVLTGGAGGAVKTSMFDVGDALEITAGSGGGGEGGSGVGGSVTSNVVIFGEGGLTLQAGDGATGGSVQTLTIGASSHGTAMITAGSGFGGGTKAANGGSVRDVEINYWIGSTNLEDISIIAGSGEMGGSGGNIENVRDKVWGIPSQALLPAEINILLQSGNGSDGEKTAGAGGSIKNIKLMAPSESSIYSFNAGNGGSSNKGGVGGSVETISILSQITAYESTAKGGKAFKTGLDPESLVGEVNITTGNGGDAFLSALGGKGGDAKTIAWNIDGLARALILGTGGLGMTGNGADGKAISVKPDPNEV